MSMIRNWVKVDRAITFKHILLWRNYKSNNEISIEQKSYGYQVIYYNRLSSSYEYLKAEKTKEEARLFAVQWMKSHPQG